MKLPVSRAVLLLALVPVALMSQGCATIGETSAERVATLRDLVTQANDATESIDAQIDALEQAIEIASEEIENMPPDLAEPVKSALETAYAMLEKRRDDKVEWEARSKLLQDQLESITAQPEVNFGDELIAIGATAQAVGPAVPGIGPAIAAGGAIIGAIGAVVAGIQRKQRQAAESDRDAVSESLDETVAGIDKAFENFGTQSPAITTLKSALKEAQTWTTRALVKDSQSRNA